MSAELKEIHTGVRTAFELTGSKPLVGSVFHGLQSAPAAHTETIARLGGKPGRVVVLVDDCTPDDDTCDAVM